MEKTLNGSFVGRGEVKGYNFNKVKETEKGFIYQKEKDGNISYEVFKKKYNKRFDCISYPTSKAFGSWAWDCKTLNRAEYILNTFK